MRWKRPGDCAIGSEMNRKKNLKKWKRARLDGHTHLPNFRSGDFIISQNEFIRDGAKSQENVRVG
jgi:hypothetical protein